VIFENVLFFIILRPASVKQRREEEQEKNGLDGKGLIRVLDPSKVSSQKDQTPMQEITMTEPGPKMSIKVDADMVKSLICTTELVFRQKTTPLKEVMENYIRMSREQSRVSETVEGYLKRIAGLESEKQALHLKIAILEKKIACFKEYEAEVMKLKSTSFGKTD
jgi:uncharacterized protein YdbL (DUF1318 family)